MSKKDFLLENGTYNKNYKNVKNVKFTGNDFFDPMDIVQVKYELLKEVKSNGKTVSEATADFGFSRTAFYAIKDAFDEHGVMGLVSEKPGPKSPHKLTGECQKLIDDCILEDPGISSSKIAEYINKNNTVMISKRTIERYRAKKKPF